MVMRNRKPALVTALSACLSLAVLGLTPAAEAARLTPTGAQATAATATTFVKAFTAKVGGSAVSVSPVDVQATSDGGSIALSQLQTSQGLGADWLVKLGSAGAPQWEEEVGCDSSHGAPGDYANGVSVEQTSDGGYIVGGGTVDCGSGTTCPPLTGESCALVEKLTSSGAVTWARVYGGSRT
jgi:hypothetical protein